MFLRRIVQRRQGQTYTYFALSETSRSPDGRVRQRTVCYLGRLDNLRNLESGSSALREGPERGKVGCAPSPSATRLSNDRIWDTGSPSSTAAMEMPARPIGTSSSFLDYDCSA